MKLNELFIHKFDELEATEYLIIIGKKTIYFIENDDNENTKEQLAEIIDKEHFVLIRPNNVNNRIKNLARFQRKYFPR